MEDLISRKFLLWGERGGVYLGEGKGGGRLEGVEGEETVDSIYCLREVSIYNKNRNMLEL